MIDITAQVGEVVRRSGTLHGLCVVYVPHATAAIVINENADPNVCQDILDALSRMVPEGAWRHDRIDNNAAAHIKATILGPSEAVPVRDGNLRLGTAPAYRGEHWPASPRRRSRCFGDVPPLSRFRHRPRRSGSTSESWRSFRLRTRRDRIS